MENKEEKPPKPPIPKNSSIKISIRTFYGDDGNIDISFYNPELDFFQLDGGGKKFEVSTFFAGTINVSIQNPTIPLVGEVHFKKGAKVTNLNNFLDDLSSQYGMGLVIEMDFTNFNGSDLDSIVQIYGPWKNHLSGLVFKNLNAPNLKDMNHFLSNVYSIEGDLTFIGNTTPALSNLSYMLENAGAGPKDLSGLDTTSVTNMEGFLMDSSYVKSLKLMTPVDNVTNVTNMFKGAASKGAFFYNKNYNYDRLKVPAGWTKTPV